MGLCRVVADDGERWLCTVLHVWDRLPKYFHCKLGDLPRPPAHPAPLLLPPPQTFQPELDAAAEAAGLRLRRLDKKAERSLVFAQRKLWEQQAAAAPDASTLLALAVPLLLARHAGRAVSLPGRALSAGVELLRAGGQLPEDACQLLADFHASVVEQLKLQSGGEGAADKQGEVAERLEAMVPRVRALLAGGGDKEGATLDVA